MAELKTRQNDESVEKFLNSGKACLYINKLADVDEIALEQLVRASVEHMQATSTE